MIDLTGKRFGKLTVIESAGTNQWQVYMWRCRCDCGKEKIIVGQSLRNGNTKSCGCIIYDRPETSRSRKFVTQICGIYKIVNPLGEVYIGGSRNIYRRWLRHREARKKLKICESIKKYGWRNHVFSIELELSVDISNDSLVKYEQKYIDHYRANGSKMLNVKDAGSKAFFSEASKIKMSLAHKGKVPWNFCRKGQIPWNKGLVGGNKMAEEYKAKKNYINA